MLHYQIYYSDCDKQKYTLLDMSHLYLWRIFPPHGKKEPNIFLSQFIIEGSGRNVLHMWDTPQDLNILDKILSYKTLSVQSYWK
jgi:hypothetical protein